MAHNLKMSNEAVNGEADALDVLAVSGYIRIYDSTGTGQPATADTAVTTQVLLAELRFGNPAFGVAAVGVLTANAITKDSSANATGTATWFRVLKSDGASPLWDGSVGTADADLVLGAVAIVIGAEVTITSMTHTLPKNA